ncbi:PREDICTED: non-specific lipid-transfer protein-like [Populus euphratica]|uniref:Non-specific lipid-transfer protein-like n=1 Tax=Populus euphratica TaxID=75702 RepID=A0AAJ6UHS4_POPEU|nr:PREDICTED: non-specific lipid-transfer protein-like [Populus euphratica]
MATVQLKSDFIFELLKRFLQTDEGIAVKNKVNLVYQFNLAPEKIGKDEVSYTIDFKKGEVIKGPYEGGKPDTTFTLRDEDFVKLADGKLNPQIAFMRGALKVKGSLSAAQKFTPGIFPKRPKL